MPMSAPIWSHPEVVASGIGALGSVGSSILGGVLGRANMDAQVKRSKDLMQYEWEHFKSPQAQVSALAAAGINPAVALGQGGSGFTATPSPTMPSPIQQPMPSIGDISGFVSAMATAKKAGLESVAQKLENDYNERTLEDRVRSVALANHWTEENITKVIQDWNKTIGEINILQKDAAIKQIDLDKHEKLVDSLIDSYAAKANLDNEQTHQLREQLPLILDKLKNEVDILSVDADVANSFKKTTSTLGVVGQGIKILQTLLKIIK